MKGRFVMPKFLIKGSYSAAGAKGLIKEGGSARKAAIEKALAGIGGKLETMYYAYGDTDVYVIADVPDLVSGVALSLTVNASGAATATTIPLLTVQEMDAACKKTVDYRGAGA
jgi:uncharacterized protein with GYD domain